MIKVGLAYQGYGLFKVVSRHGHEEVAKAFEVGEIVNAELRRPRSVSQNNLFHALCEAAFDNQREGPEFATWRHLKSWVLTEAGYCEEYRCGAGSMTKKVAAVLRQKNDTLTITQDKKTGEIVLRFAHSMSFDKMTPEDATDALNKTAEIITQQIVPGVTKEQLLDMAKQGVA